METSCYHMNGLDCADGLKVIVLSQNLMERKLIDYHKISNGYKEMGNLSRWMTKDDPTYPELHPSIGWILRSKCPMVKQLYWSVSGCFIPLLYGLDKISFQCGCSLCRFICNPGRGLFPRVPWVPCEVKCEKLLVENGDCPIGVGDHKSII